MGKEVEREHLPVSVPRVLCTNVSNRFFAVDIPWTLTIGQHRLLRLRGVLNDGSVLQRLSNH